jgi:hypothetical protein
MEILQIRLTPGELADLHMLVPKDHPNGPVSHLIRGWIVAYIGKHKKELDEVKEKLSLMTKPTSDPNPSVRDKDKGTA